MNDQTIPGAEAPSFRFLPLTVSLETRGGIATPLVLRGSPLPAARVQSFSTVEDEQSAVTIRLSIGERPIFSDNIQLAEVELTGIPPQPRGTPQIELRVEVDRFCNVLVTALEKSSGQSLEIQGQPPAFSLSQNEVQRLLGLAEEQRDADQQALRELEQKFKAEDLIARAESHLKMRGSSTEVSKFLAELGLALEANNAAAIRAKSASLEAILNRPLPPFPDIFGPIFSEPLAGSNKASSAKSPVAEKAEKQHQSRHSRSDVSETAHSTAKLGAIFGGGEFTLDPTLCFVLMPFEARLQPIYDDHIKQVVDGESLACIRADDIVGTRQITTDIWENINRARFLLADLTGQNANVFYELGLAHALGKEVILLSQSMTDVPFDLRSVRCLVYEYTPPGMRSLEQKLRRTIRELMAG